MMHGPGLSFRSASPSVFASLGCFLLWEEGGTAPYLPGSLSSSPSSSTSSPHTSKGLLVCSVLPGHLIVTLPVKEQDTGLSGPSHLPDFPAWRPPPWGCRSWGGGALPEPQPPISHPDQRPRPDPTKARLLRVEGGAEITARWQLPCHPSALG